MSSRRKALEIYFWNDSKTVL